MISSMLNRHHRLVKILFWFVLLVVTFLSLLPNYYSPMPVAWSDKGEHFIAYLALGGLAGIGWWLKDWPALIRVFFILVIIGGAIEMAQGMLITGRTASWLDLLADGLGAASGLLVSWWLCQRL